MKKLALISMAAAFLTACPSSDHDNDQPNLEPNFTPSGKLQIGVSPSSLNSASPEEYYKSIYESCRSKESLQKRRAMLKVGATIQYKKSQYSSRFKPGWGDSTKHTDRTRVSMETVSIVKQIDPSTYKMAGTYYSKNVDGNITEVTDAGIEGVLKVKDAFIDSYQNRGPRETKTRYISQETADANGERIKYSKCKASEEEGEKEENFVWATYTLPSGKTLNGVLRTVKTTVKDFKCTVSYHKPVQEPEPEVKFEYKPYKSEEVLVSSLVTETEQQFGSSELLIPFIDNCYGSKRIFDKSEAVTKEGTVIVRSLDEITLLQVPD